MKKLKIQMSSKAKHLSLYFSLFTSEWRFSEKDVIGGGGDWSITACQVSEGFADAPSFYRPIDGITDKDFLR